MKCQPSEFLALLFSDPQTSYNFVFLLFTNPLFIWERYFPDIAQSLNVGNVELEKLGII